MKKGEVFYAPKGYRRADAWGYWGPDGKYYSIRQLTAKVPVPLGTQFKNTWHSLNKPRELGGVKPSRKQGLGILCLVLVAGILLADQAMKTAGSPFSISKKQTLWETTFATGNLEEWVTVLATFEGTGNCVSNKCIKMSPNSTHAAIALVKQPVLLDTVSGHELFIALAYRVQASSPSNNGYRWSMYLTRNATIPLTAGYNPRSDSQVALSLEVDSTSGSGANSYAWIQKNQLDPIINGDQGAITNVGTNFITHSFTQCIPEANGTNEVNLLLNFTGSQGVLAKSALETDIVDCGGALSEDTTEVLPWLQFQSTQYYIGFWAQTGLPTPIKFEGASGSNHNRGVYRADPFVSQSTNVPQTLDTGGFFGPIIRALIGVGVWILEGISEYLGFVADVFVTAMNAVGRFFGLGNIGTAIRDALVGVATWVNNVFGNIFVQSINIATAISNTLLTALQLAGTYWTRVTDWLSGLKDLFGLWWGFIAFFGIGLPVTSLVTLWLIMGIIMSYNSQDGFFRWMRGTWIVTATVFNVLWAIGERAFEVILNVKRLLAQWL